MASNLLIPASHSRPEPNRQGNREVTVAGALMFLILVSAVIARAHWVAAETVEFRAHIIEAKMPGGYAVLVTDFNARENPFQAAKDFRLSSTDPC